LHGVNNVAGIEALQMVQVLEHTGRSRKPFILQRNIFFLTHRELLTPCVGTLP
jgi:hypothetical protein